MMRTLTMEKRCPESGAVRRDGAWWGESGERLWHRREESADEMRQRAAVARMVRSLRLESRVLGIQARCLGATDPYAAGLNEGRMRLRFATRAILEVAEFAMKVRP